MVKLVDTLEQLPTCDLATQPMIQFHYAFALNRYTPRGFHCVDVSDKVVETTLSESLSVQRSGPSKHAPLFGMG